MAIVSYLIGLVGLAAAGFFGYRLWRWERILKGARIVIQYKGKTKMSPRLFDWMVWVDSLEGNARVRSRSVYKIGGTTISITKPMPLGHGKTKTRTVQEKRAA